MRKSHCGLKGREINLNDSIIFRIFIRFIDMIFLLRMGLNIFQSLFVHRENTVLSTGFNGHLANGEAVIHGQRSHPLSGKLNGLVKGSIHTDQPDQMKNQILTADMFL